MSDLFALPVPGRQEPGRGDRRRPLSPVPVPDGELLYERHFYAPTEAAELLRSLTDETPWAAHRIRMFGRWVQEPRLTAWYGDPGAAYTYSGRKMEPLPWTDRLERVRRDVEAAVSVRFNSVLLNLYRNGRDSMGWHSDDEPELGAEPVIASVSLGAERRFLLRHRTRAGERREFLLAAGSLLVMRGALQHHWIHSVPRSLRVTAPRINLTFRRIDPAPSLL